MTELTKFERATLEILRDRGPVEYTSAVGFMLLDAFDGIERKPNPSPQGVALFAGRFLRNLQRRGLVRGGGGWRITKQGREAIGQQKGGAA